jgi:DNA invertase Pin-like site-specific DNA recombinase
MRSRNGTILKRNRFEPWHRSADRYTPFLAQFKLVSQTIGNQLRELAEQRGWELVQIYNDAGISGAKGRADRPGLEAIDRLGRSLIDLLGAIQHLEAVGVDQRIKQEMGAI